jgi:hypothetical protein
MPDVAVAASYEELAALPDMRFPDPREESLLYRLKYSAAPDRAGEILFAFGPMILLGGPPDHDPAQHGTAYDYDRHVPIIFWGPWEAKERWDPVSTVDIAPTLAEELSLQPEQRLDGVPLDLQSLNPSQRSSATQVKIPDRSATASRFLGQTPSPSH